jgi:hypothetical protein
MRFPTDHELFIFLLGAAIGAVITYYNTTREKRIIYRVRKTIEGLCDYHDLHFVSIYGELNSSRKASDEQILARYRAAESDLKSSMCSKEVKKLGPIVIAAEIFICQELLDVPTSVGIQALLKYKNGDELLEYWKQKKEAYRLIDNQ